MGKERGSVLDEGVGNGDDIQKGGYCVSMGIEYTDGTFSGPTVPYMP